MSLNNYLPQDRLRSLSIGHSLPDRTFGSALFADITGYTPLTEAWRESLGSRRGAEEMTRQLSRVYDQLITEVERYGGSVIDFAGDAIMCWFDNVDGTPEVRAILCALKLQQVMHSLKDVTVPAGTTANLEIKVAVTTGTARRFIVGDPKINYLDILAGDTIARISAGEHLAQKGEVLADLATVEKLGDALKIVEWRNQTQLENELRFAVVKEYSASPPSLLFHEMSSSVAENELKAWLPAGIYEREKSGGESLMAEFRPCVALFASFSGIDYSSVQAWEQLNSLIVLMQNTAERFGGNLLQITIGDKGSYVYINIGALTMHEDDCRRAVNLAIVLREATRKLGFVLPIQIGITQGTLFVGKYGSANRKAFGAMGADVNLAARLMTTADSDKILISGRVRKAVLDEFLVEARPHLKIKGKAEPIPVFSVLSVKQKRSVRLQEPDYTLPMIGRAKELSVISDRLALATQGFGQVVGITAEAGMGKSRLIAEGIRLAHRNNLIGYGGACKSDGVGTPYLVWNPIWNAFFDVDPVLPLRKQIRSVEVELEDRAPENLDALPLLASILSLPFSDNNFTRALQPRDRKIQLESLLIKLLRSTAREQAQNGGGVLLVLEDLHWIDPVSSDLLEIVAKAIQNLPILILLTYRPSEEAAALLPIANLKLMNHFTEISLKDLDVEESEQIIRGKLSQLFPEQRGAVPQMLINRITHRAQGNPFYVEELLNFLHDSGIDPRNTDSLMTLELPASLQSLILSRIDQLTSSQQTTLKLASIIGRAFRFDLLCGYYPSLGSVEQVKSDLLGMSHLDITVVESPEPQLAFLFKHLITQEVSYESIAFGTRAELHGRYAEFMEITYKNELERFAPQLAYHYEKAQIHTKAVFYLTIAGEQAAANYANDEALSNFTRALKLEADDSSRSHFDILMKRERVYDLLGQRTEQRQDLTKLSQLVETFDDAILLRSQISIRLTKLEIDLGDYSAAKTHAQSAIRELSPVHEQSPDLLVDALLLEARAMFLAGQAIASKPQLDNALSQARAHGYVRGEYNALAQLGLWNWYNSDNKTAVALLEESLVLIRKAGDVRRELEILNNLGIVKKDMYQFADSLAHYEKSQQIAKKIGDRSGEASLLNNMGRASIVAGDFVNALLYCSQAENLAQEINDSTVHGLALHNKSETYRELGQYESAKVAAEESLKVLRSAGYPVGEAYTIENLAMIELALGSPHHALELAEQALAITRKIAARRVEASVLTRSGLIQLEIGNLDEAHKRFLEASQLEKELDEPILKFEIEAGLAQVALKNGLVDISLIQNLLNEILKEPATEQSHFLALGLYLTSIRVMMSMKDERVSKLITRSQAELKARSARITEAPARESFLNIAEHHAIAELANDKIN